MKFAEIRRFAQARGVEAGHLAKAELIRVIQRKEGNFDCFGSPSEGCCDQPDCLWRQDCLASKRWSLT
jgi:hypothetical protein